MKCENFSMNKEKCECSYTDCERHGFCCECVAYHKKNGELPQCLQ